MKPDQLKALAKSFGRTQRRVRADIWCPTCVASKIRQCAKHTNGLCTICGNVTSEAHDHVDYIPWASIQQRLFEIDPLWTWKPVATHDNGIPLIPTENGMVRVWVELTVCGRKELGVADAGSEALGEFGTAGALTRAKVNAAKGFGCGLIVKPQSPMVCQPLAPESLSTRDQPERSPTDNPGGPSWAYMAGDAFTEAQLTVKQMQEWAAIYAPVRPKLSGIPGASLLRIGTHIGVEDPREVARLIALNLDPHTALNQDEEE